MLSERERALLERTASGAVVRRKVGEISDGSVYEDWMPPEAVALIARSILDIYKQLNTVKPPTFDPLFQASASATGFYVTDKDTLQLGGPEAPAISDSPILDIRAVDDPPITAEELQRRGITPDLEGRAIDVVLRMGWPRKGDPLGMRPCVPVPVELLEEMRAKAQFGGALWVILDAMLSEQVEIVKVYGATVPEPEQVEAGD